MVNYVTNTKLGMGPSTWVLVLKHFEVHIYTFESTCAKLLKWLLPYLFQCTCKYYAEYLLCTALGILMYKYFQVQQAVC